ncbi:MAG: hypothetical protein ABL888_17470 [Pirellulaceae bacterium]
MGWEARNGKGLYYTRSKRVNGKVVREYVGTGVVAQLAFQQDESKRLHAQTERKTLKIIQERDRVLNAQFDAFTDLTEKITFSLLMEAGYHQHNRGEWRAKRGNG